MPVPIDTKDNWQGPNLIITYSFLITVVIVTPSEHP